MPLDGTDYQDAETLALANARHYVELGWCQRLMHDGKGNHCLLGAISQAVGGSITNPAFRRVVDRVARRLPATEKYEPDPELCELLTFHQVNKLMNFNDTRGRTKAQVLAVLDRALGR